MTRKPKTLIVKIGLTKISERVLRERMSDFASLEQALKVATCHCSAAT